MLESWFFAYRQQMGAGALYRRLGFQLARDVQQVLTAEWILPSALKELQQ